MRDAITYILIGLGNPGPKYKNNRHNAGHMFVDSIKRSGVRGQFILTDVFMNESGVCVKKILSANPYPLSALYIAHDDLDIPLGKFKIQMGVGPKVHNGLDSVEEHLGTKDFWRVRIGIDNRDPKRRIPGEKYVLQDFTKEEREILSGLFPKIWEELARRL